MWLSQDSPYKGILGFAKRQISLPDCIGPQSNCSCANKMVQAPKKTSMGAMGVVLKGDQEEKNTSLEAHFLRHTHIKSRNSGRKQCNHSPPTTQCASPASSTGNEARGCGCGSSSSSTSIGAVPLDMTCFMTSQGHTRAQSSRQPRLQPHLVQPKTIVQQPARKVTQGTKHLVWYPTTSQKSTFRVESDPIRIEGLESLGQMPLHRRVLPQLRGKKALTLGREDAAVGCK